MGNSVKKKKKKKPRPTLVYKLSEKQLNQTLASVSTSSSSLRSRLHCAAGQQNSVSVFKWETASFYVFITNPERFTVMVVRTATPMITHHFTMSTSSVLCYCLD